MKAHLMFISLAIFIAKFTSAQDVHLHVNPKWKECSFQLDPSLTQAEWKKFTREAGLVTYFKPLSDAKPMGVGRFEVAILQWNTRIDETTGAWNNTFVHPNDTHWLIGGKELPFPGFTARAGISKKIDAGIYWSARPGANYGVYGGQMQYNLVNDTLKNWAVATRLGFNHLYGPDDLTLTVYGTDVLASKEFKLISSWAAISPYAGVSAYFSHSHEKSAVVNLNDENIIGVHSMVGAIARIYMVRIGVEYDFASVNSLSYKLGASFRIKSK